MFQQYLSNRVHFWVKEYLGESECHDLTPAPTILAELYSVTLVVIRESDTVTFVADANTYGCDRT